MTHSGARQLAALSQSFGLHRGPERANELSAQTSLWEPIDPDRLNNN